VSDLFFFPLRIEPGYTLNLMALASILLDMERPGGINEGRGLMDRAVQLEPLNADLHSTRGSLLAQIGRF